MKAKTLEEKVFDIAEEAYFRGVKDGVESALDTLFTAKLISSEIKAVFYATIDRIIQQIKEANSNKVEKIKTDIRERLRRQAN